MKFYLILSLFSFNASAAVYTPAEALHDVRAEPLTFIGRGLLYGSVSIPSCLFKNSRAYVVHRYCTRPEVGAGDVSVYSFARKQAVKIHAESPQNKSPISETDPKTYPPEFWYIALGKLAEDFSPQMNFEQFAQYFEKHARQYPPSCYVSSRFTHCDEALKDLSPWLAGAAEFRKSPPAEWINVLKLMKELARE